MDLDRLTDTRSAEYASIGADTDPEYQIDASLSVCSVNDTHVYNSAHISQHICSVSVSIYSYEGVVYSEI